MIMFKQLFSLFVSFLLLSNFSLFAQGDHQLSPSEKLAMPAYLSTRPLSSNGVASVLPPSSPVRTIGEWEELQGLLVTWTSYTPMIREIIRAARLECKVYVVCSNSASVISSLLANNVDTSNVVFVNTSFNSVWSRDYGPWSAYTNDVDSLLTIDWIYNRPRPQDDLVPVAIAGVLNTPLYQTTTAPWDLVHTGGNFMTDGFGTGFSSDLILNENSNHTPAQIDTIMSRFMGINRYIRMTTLPYDVIHHIDMHLKLLDEETLLVGQYPTGVADGPQIEANLQYILNNYPSVYGTPYKVVRIPMPPDNGAYPNTTGNYYTYTNSSFINKTIIVPTYGIPQDSTALRIYREALPGYTVTPINSSASITALGALHCITKELGTADPLLISHHALPNTTDTINGYSAIAKIQHRSGINNATLYYRTDTLLPYQSIAMNSLSSQQNYWGAIIPPQSAGTTVYYYIHAEAASGKQQVRPMPAPVAYWNFQVTGLTGIENIAGAKNTIQPLFPNPGKGITCIPVQLAASATVDANLFDVDGRKIMNVFHGKLSSGDRKLFMDTSTTPEGIYFLKINIGAEQFTEKVAVR
jgi:agmatine/peptidylarginine deiminase